MTKNDKVCESIVFFMSHKDMELQKEPTFGNAGYYPERCWQNATLQALRCSPSFKKMIATEFPDPDHVLYQVFVATPPESQYIEKPFNNTFGTLGVFRPGDSMVLIRRLELYLQDLLSIMIRDGYKFNAPFYGELQKESIFYNPAGGLPDTLIYLFSILFNDTVSYSSSLQLSNKRIYTQSSISEPNPTFIKRVVHFHKRSNENVIPENTVAILAMKRLSAGMLGLGWYAWLYPQTGFIWTILQGLTFNQLTSFPVHLVCFCHDQKKDLWYDNDTLTYNANTNIVTKVEMDQLFQISTEQLLDRMSSPMPTSFVDTVSWVGNKVIKVDALETIAKGLVNQPIADIFVTDDIKQEVPTYTPTPPLNTTPEQAGLVLHPFSVAVARGEKVMYTDTGDVIEHQNGTFYLNGVPTQFIHLLTKYSEVRIKYVVSGGFDILLSLGYPTRK